MSLFLILCSSPRNNAQDANPLIYLLPGQGADCRLFSRIDFPYDTVHLEFPLPEKGCTLREYAYSFIRRIDTGREIILIGVSLGGMISSELADTLSPLKVIVISSAKFRKELPGRYKFQQIIPLNQIMPARTIHRGALFMAPRVEPERKNDTLFRDMLMKKDPQYLKRTVNMIVNWKKADYRGSIIHIHGDQDHTIPLKNISCDYIIPGGTHMMVYIRAAEISGLINKILLE